MIILKKRKLINTSIIFIAIIAICFGGFFYYKLNKIQNISAGETKQKEIDTIISKVSHLYLIPNGEIPTVATVSDPAISFFKLSEKGDKVLIFSKSGRAVLYRPSIDKIVEIVSVKNTLEF